MDLLRLALAYDRVMKATATALGTFSDDEVREMSQHIDAIGAIIKRRCVAEGVEWKR